jgi:hypothetical protein
LQRHAIRRKLDVSEENIASICRVEENIEQNTNRSRQQAHLSKMTLPSVSSGFLLGLYFDPENEGEIF